MSKHILVVEDFADLRRDIIDVLEIEGYTAAGAGAAEDISHQRGDLDRHQLVDFGTHDGLFSRFFMPGPGDFAVVDLVRPDDAFSAGSGRPSTP